MSKKRKKTLVIISYVAMVYDDENSEPGHQFGSMPVDYSKEPELMPSGRALYQECDAVLHNHMKDMFGKDLHTVSILGINII
jgi:hypothetical protein